MSLVQAAVLEQFKAPLQLREFPLPAQLEPGACLIRTEMAGICGTDIHLWKGELPIGLPVILGHETVGRIERLGEGLEKDWTGQALRVGDRVTWNSSTSCGQCYYCRQKNQPTRCAQRKAYGIGYRCDQPPHLLGGYAQFHYLRPGATIFRLPDSLPTEVVIGAGCALITAIHGIERICGEVGMLPAGASVAAQAAMPVLPAMWNESVVIQGAGPVGIAALAVARNAGAKRIVVIGGPAHRLAMARRFSADEVVDLDQTATAERRREIIREMTGGYGADTVIECVGHPSAVVEGMELCRDGGKYLILGHYCDAGPTQWNPHVVTRKQLQVYGSWSSEPRHLNAAIHFLDKYQDRYPFGAMVTHRFSLAQANEAMRTTASLLSAKSVLVPGIG